MVVLRSMIRVNTPPSVSIPSDSGVTSSNNTSLTSPCSTPAWMAAPTATTSSGLTPLCGSLPNSCFTTSCTFGMLERLLAGLHCLLNEIVDQRFKLGAGELHRQMLRTCRVRRDERQIDLGLRRR